MLIPILPATPSKNMITKLIVITPAPVIRLFQGSHEERDDITGRIGAYIFSCQAQDGFIRCEDRHDMSWEAEANSAESITASSQVKDLLHQIIRGETEKTIFTINLTWLIKNRLERTSLFDCARCNSVYSVCRCRKLIIS